MESGHVSILSFIFKDRLNRIYLFSTLIFTSIGWLLFKHIYPNPNLIFDSYYYTTAAVNHSTANAWPVGYSWFIQLVGTFSHSVNFILTVQHALLVLSLLFFFFTIRFLFTLSSKTSWILLALIFANPIFPYICNLVLSDVLFTALSLLWISQLLWILFRPKSYMLIIHAIILLLAFSVRYNALYYPFIATLSFLFSRQPVTQKLAGVLLQFLLIGIFIAYTTHQMKTQYKVAQFSPFGGWKLANDALYMYEHVFQQDSTPPPIQFQALDTRVRQYFRHKHYQVGVDVNDPTWGSFYMYIHPSPLIQHMFSIYGKDAPNVNLNFKKFALLGPLYQDYGAYLIKKHPTAFARHFVVPNIYRYFYPPQEVLIDYYNPFTLRTDYLGQPAIQWFGIKTLGASSTAIQLRTSLFSLYPVTIVMLHLLFLFTSISFFSYKGYKYTSNNNIALLIIASLWLSDFIFSISAAAIVLRYQLFIMVTEISFSLVFMELYFRVGSTPSHMPKEKKQSIPAESNTVPS